MVFSDWSKRLFNCWNLCISPFDFLFGTLMKGVWGVDWTCITLWRSLSLTSEKGSSFEQLGQYHGLVSFCSFSQYAELIQTHLMWFYLLHRSHWTDLSSCFTSFLQIPHGYSMVILSCYIMVNNILLLMKYKWQWYGDRKIRYVRVTLEKRQGEERTKKKRIIYREREYIYRER